jgi:hypothetical protein
VGAVATVIRHAINAYLKGLKYIMNKPSWKNRRRYILASFIIGAIMLTGSTFAALTGNMTDISDLVTGGVALITLILTSYIFGAVWEDKSLYKKEENGDG